MPNQLPTMKPPNMWRMSKSFLPEQLRQETAQAPAMQIPGLGYMAWKQGVRNPITDASRTLFEAMPGSRQYQKANRFLSQQVHPKRALGMFRNIFGPRGMKHYGQYARQLGLEHPNIEPWRRLASRTWAARQSRRGKPMGPGSMAVPPAVWQQGLQESRRKMWGEPYYTQKSRQRARQRIDGSFPDVATQWLRGRKDLSFEDVLQQGVRYMLSNRNR